MRVSNECFLHVCHPGILVLSLSSRRILSFSVVGLCSRMYWHGIAAAAAAAAFRGGRVLPASWRQRFPDARWKVWPSFQRCATMNRNFPYSCFIDLLCEVCVQLLDVYRLGMFLTLHVSFFISYYSVFFFLFFFSFTLILFQILFFFLFLFLFVGGSKSDFSLGLNHVAISLHISFNKSLFRPVSENTHLWGLFSLFFLPLFFLFFLPAFCFSFSVLVLVFFFFFVCFFFSSIWIRV